MLSVDQLALNCVPRPVIAISLTENRRHQSRCYSAEFSLLRLPTDKEGLSQAEHSAVCRDHRLECPAFYVPDLVRETVQRGAENGEGKGIRLNRS
jgi:hypothetical protein